MARIGASVGPGDVLLDAGCGEGKLRTHLPSSAHYVGLDRYLGDQENEYSNWTMRPNVLGDVHQLPMASESCQVVALMHVLEHVRDPALVFSEIARVLRPSGYAFIDVPFFHEIHHAPYDYFRYTSYGLDALACDSGLKIEDIRPSGGYFRALAHILIEAPNVIVPESFAGRLTLFLVAYPICGFGLLIRKIQYLLDLQDQSQNFTSGYHCILRKPVNER
jgi:SAM-dependent methyltransferase